MLSACQETLEIPKPRTYPRVVFPNHSYNTVAPDPCPFSMDIPVYSKLEKEKQVLGNEAAQDCWYTLRFNKFNAEVYFSYFSIDDRKHYDKLLKDSYFVLQQINRKSDFMEESRYENKHNTHGLTYSFEGDAASPFQFILSDTTDHFVRGALYFNSKVNPDSMKPVIDFVRVDMDRMLSSFVWD